MILVLSYHSYEQGTDPVISWLLHYKVPFIKVSLHDLLYHKTRYHIDLQNRDIVINGVSVKNTITTIWHRRFLREANTISYAVGEHQAQLNFEVKTEVCDLVDYLELLFRDKKWLTAYHQIKVNKLELLDKASELGLRVPHSKVLNNRQDLQEFYDAMGQQLVSKPISDVRNSYRQDEHTYVVLTNNIDEEKIAALPEYFFPSLFQEKVDIDFEIRIFYLEGRFFPTATINSAPTNSVDKKLDSYSRYTHYVPYRVPAAVEQKLEQLMQAIDLNTGCIDLLKTKAGEYVFIEVNPVGQYLAESTFCNYGAEKEIAEWLIKNDNP